MSIKKILSIIGVFFGGMLTGICTILLCDRRADEDSEGRITESKTTTEDIGKSIDGIEGTKGNLEQSIGRSESVLDQIQKQRIEE